MAPGRGQEGQPNQEGGRELAYQGSIEEMLQDTVPPPMIKKGNLVGEIFLVTRKLVRQFWNISLCGSFIDAFGTS